MAKRQRKIGAEPSGAAGGQVRRGGGDRALGSSLGNVIQLSLTFREVLPEAPSKALAEGLDHLVQGQLSDLRNQPLEFTILNWDLLLNRFNLK